MSGSYDIVIVGGGIHGVGVAQAAAAAGHSVLVLEKTALAAGTSSRSSKLIHGGLRYLENLELSLVRECLRERALLLRLAPELVVLRDFHVPVFRWTERRPWLIRTGLTLYAALGGFRDQFRFGTVPRSRRDELDGLITDDLDTVFRYRDGQTDDALLTAAVMRSAQDLGAELALPARFEGAELTGEGCEVRYRDDRERSCRARVLVNAAGPWVNRVLDGITPPPQRVPIQLVQGSHILVPGKLERGVYYVESPADRRAVFVMPRGDATLVGTTEVPFVGEEPDRVRPSEEERAYLVDVLERYFPGRAPETSDAILEAWAGIRVLPAEPGAAFHVSRETVLAADRTKPRLLSIYGGKLTTYRSTAEKVMQRIAPSLPRRKTLADTRELALTPPS